MRRTHIITGKLEHTSLVEGVLEVKKNSVRPSYSNNKLPTPSENNRDPQESKL